MFPGIPFEYYASISGLEPKSRFTLEQHQGRVFGLGVGDFYQYGREFFERNSGLSPVEDFDIDQHIIGYFSNVGGNWTADLIQDAVNRFGSGLPFRLYPQLTLYPSNTLFPR